MGKWDLLKYCLYSIENIHVLSMQLFKSRVHHQSVLVQAASMCLFMSKLTFFALLKATLNPV